MSAILCGRHASRIYKPPICRHRIRWQEGVLLAKRIVVPGCNGVVKLRRRPRNLDPRGVCGRGNIRGGARGWSSRIRGRGGISRRSNSEADGQWQSQQKSDCGTATRCEPEHLRRNSLNCFDLIARIPLRTVPAGKTVPGDNRTVTNLSHRLSTIERWRRSAHQNRTPLESAHSEPPISTEITRLIEEGRLINATSDCNSACSCSHGGRRDSGFGR